MRGFDVYMFHLAKDQTEQKYVKNYETACFADISRLHKRENIIEKDIIYLDDYIYPETEEYIDLVVKTINEITPCSIEDGYIKVKLLPLYDQSLIVLNFIRALWDGNYPNYSESLFDALSKETEGDALEKLLKANKIACQQSNIRENNHHSNCYEYEKLKIKTIEQLLEFKKNSTYIFLTQE